MKNKKGFSIVEVMVVVVGIIFVLVALLLLVLHDAREAGRKGLAEQKKEEFYAKQLASKASLPQGTPHLDRIGEGSNADAKETKKEIALPKIKFSIEESSKSTKIIVFYDYPNSYDIKNLNELLKYKEDIEFLLSQLNETEKKMMIHEQ